MKTFVHSVLWPAFSFPLAAMLLVNLATRPSLAADRNWTGGGGDNLWSTPANWGGTAPGPNDALFFGGNVRTTPVNDFGAGTVFSGITFNVPAAAFSLSGNAITLGGTIGDNMPGVPQTINFPIVLNATRTVNVADNGLLNLGGVISGAGFGLIKTGNGVATLTASNTFSGSVTVNAGSVSVVADANLGAVPGAATPGKIVIDGGALRATNSLTLDSKRGILLGATAAVGTINVVQNSRINMGTFTVAPYTGASSIDYGGIIAGSAGLVKSGFGGLTLGGANTFSGPTSVKVGTLRLDFSAAGAPANNMIPSGSALTLGGENAVFSGAGAQSFAALVLTGKDNTTNSQSFSSMTNDLGQTYIRLNSGNNGGVNLNLAGLNHKTGGGVIFIPPANGAVKTSSANDSSGILGGWATVSTNSAPIQNGTIIMSQSFAAVDNTGAIVPYTGVTTYAIADDTANVNLNSAGFIGKNVLIVGGANHAATVAQVDTPGAGTTTEINTITFAGMRNDQGNTAVPSDGVFIGANNTLRLGRYGAVFRSDAALGVGNVQINCFIGGPADAPQSGQGTTGAQNVGTLTAGGADNTPGEIVLHVNNHNQTTGRMNVQAKIADNGSGPVSVIKTGPGGLKINGHNTFSGGTYVIQGLIQLTGSEQGGTANPDGLGTGPVYIFNGGRVSLALGINPQDYYIAGVGTDQENFGAIIAQNGSIHTGKLTLIGDARVARSGNAAGVLLAGQITDNGAGFNLELGNGGSSDNLTLTNVTPNPNNWSGNTIIGRGRTSLGADEQIPDGLSKGNLVLNSDGTAGNLSILNLNGRYETVNGLTTAGNAANANITIENGAGSTTATLAVGNNDQSSSFRGVIQNGAGTVALTKIGRGKLTLTAANTYSGITTISNGTLALSGGGSIASSAQILVSGGTFDVSELSSGFTHGFPIELNNGTLAIRNTTLPGISSLDLADSRIRVASLGATPVVVETSVLSTGGTTNLIDIGSIGAITAYPAQFTIIKYTSFGGGGFNFGLGNVPTPSTVGYVSNNIDNSSIDLVLLDGPKPLTWTGARGVAWDVNATTNWLAFGSTPSVYLDVDSVRFDDTGMTGNVNLTTNLQPGSILVNNSALAYTFFGNGNISGPTGLTKDGSGTLTMDGAGTNDFFGPITINAGTLLVNVGTLGTGPVLNNATLAFDRSDAHTFSNTISGTGTVIQDDDGPLTLSAANDYSGPTVVAGGTLRAGNNLALGTIVGATTVESGATLDIGANNINLGAEPIIISGTGVGGNGAIVNNSGSATFVGPNITRVTMAGDATFGGSGRLDFRSTPADTGTDATLSTGGNAYKLTKVGSNQLQLAGVQVDAGLGEIEVQQGILGLEGTMPSLGSTTHPLTVFGNATLRFSGLASVPDKPLVLKEGAIVNNASGASTYGGAVALEGTARFDIAGTSLTLNGEMAGPGGVIKTGAGSLIVGGPFSTYGGTTTVSNGTLLVEGSHEGGAYTVSGGTLGGRGLITAPVTVNSGGTLSPGSPGNAIGTLSINGSLQLAGTNLVDVNRTGGGLMNDQIRDITALTLGGTLRLNLTGDPLLEGDAIGLFQFTSAVGSFAAIIPGSPGVNLAWETSQLTVDGTLRVVAAVRPQIADVSLSGTNLVVTGTNGVAGRTYYVLTSTNVALPVTNWTRLQTNMFDVNGHFNFTNAVAPNTPQRFYLIVTP